MAARLKVIELAKELGVTSKDLIVALEAMGQKSVRAMTPLDVATANELRVKLGRGREIPVDAKPKRPAKSKVAAPADGGPVEDGAAADSAPDEVKPARKGLGRTAPPVEPPVVEVVRPAATIFRPVPTTPVRRARRHPAGFGPAGASDRAARRANPPGAVARDRARSPRGAAARRATASRGAADRRPDPPGRRTGRARGARAASRAPAPRRAAHAGPHGAAASGHASAGRAPGPARGAAASGCGPGGPRDPTRAATRSGRTCPDRGPAARAAGTPGRDQARADQAPGVRDRGRARRGDAPEVGRGDQGPGRARRHGDAQRGAGPTAAKLVADKFQLRRGGPFDRGRPARGGGGRSRPAPAATAGRHRDGPRRPRQDVAARCDPHDQGGGARARAASPSTSGPTRSTPATAR